MRVGADHYRGFPVDALEVVRGYLREQHLDRYLDAAADDEGADLGPGLRAIATDADGPSGVRVTLIE